MKKLARQDLGHFSILLRQFHCTVLSVRFPPHEGTDLERQFARFVIQLRYSNNSPLRPPAADAVC